MAYYTKLEAVPLEALKQMLQTLNEKARRELGSATEIVTRSLRPEDFGLTGEWSFATGGTGWVNYVSSATIADNRFVGIYGIRNLTTTAPQKVTQIRITRAGTLARYWDIQGVNQFENPEVFFDDPITIDQNTTIKIECYSVASATEKLMFVGQVVEKRGLLINP